MPSDAWDPPESAPRRLSPLSMLLAVRPQTLLVIVIATVGSGGLAIALLVPILAVVVAIQAVTWSAFRWGFDGRVVRVAQGVLQRSVRGAASLRDLRASKIHLHGTPATHVHRLIRWPCCCHGGGPILQRHGLSGSRCSCWGEKTRKIKRQHAE